MTLTLTLALTLTLTSHPHPHQVEFALLHSSLPAAKGWNACSSVGLCLCLVGKA